MTFGFNLSRNASNYVRRLDGKSQARIANAIRALCEDPFGPGTKPLRAAGSRRSLRVGGWRVIYEVDVAGQRLLIGDVGPRGEVYRNLDR